MFIPGIQKGRRTNQKGFTLVELLVVIAIIGMLATLVLLQLGTARSRARDARRISDINQLRSAIEQYYNDNTSYPTAITAVQLGVYLARIPTDPSTGAVYGYDFDPAASPSRFHLWAELEGVNPAFSGDADMNSTAFAGAPAGVNGATEACTAAANDCVYDQGVN